MSAVAFAARSAVAMRRTGDFRRLSMFSGLRTQQQVAPVLQARLAVQGLDSVRVRWMSTGKDDGSDSHPDFAAKSKVPTTDGISDEVMEFVRESVKEHDVLLFMKGSPGQPQCGFSAKVVKILEAEDISFSSANVLKSDDIRAGVKTFS